MQFRWQFLLYYLLASCSIAVAQKPPAPSTAASDHLVSAHATSIPPAPAARPVARVNGAVLTDHDLLREMYTIFPYARQHNGGFPKPMEADIRRGALQMIEFEELVYQEATHRQWTIAPERLAAAEKQFRQHFETNQQYQYFLQTESQGSEQVMRAKIKRSLMIEDFLKREINDKSAVSSAEAKVYYQNNPEQFKLPDTYSLQTITVMPPQSPGTQPGLRATNPETDKQMRARAEAEWKQAKATKNYEEFGGLAEKVSDDDYRVMMGDHRVVDVKNIPPPILAAVSKLQVGQVSDVIPVDGSYTIVRLNAHTPARLQTFAEAGPSLRAQLQSRKTERLRREWDARLRKNAKIEEI